MATIRLTVLNSIKDASGKLPILICISQKKERSYIKTDLLIDDLSEFGDGKVVYRKDAGIMNKRIQFVLSQYRDKFDAVDSIDFLTSSQIKSIITAKERPSHISFIEYWRKRIDDFKGDGRDGYAKMNEDTIKTFIKAEGESIPIPALNNKTVEHYYKWMLRNNYSIGGIGLRLSHLKARINELIRDGVLKTEIHPFAYTKIPSAEAKECDMSIGDFRKIASSELDGKKLNLAKDMILLSFYLCGMNLKDILHHNFSEETLSYERIKTKGQRSSDRKITIPIHQEARNIINRYIKNGIIELGYSYSYRNLQCYINLCMKELREHLGIKSTICFYSSRKTFAQFASELGIPDSVIDYCLGHSSKGRGIISYYTKVKYKQAEIAINRVIDYTNDPDKYKDYIEMRADIMMMKG